MHPGDVVPAIAVDPDPAKRPECIVIRMDQAMVDQTCALNQNYHEMLSQKMQQNYQFNTPTGVVRTYYDMGKLWQRTSCSHRGVVRLCGTRVLDF